KEHTMSDDVETMLQAAEAAIAKKDYDRAEVLIDRVLSKAKVKGKVSAATVVDDDWSGTNDEVDEEDGDDEEEIEKASDPANQDRGDDHQNMGPVRFDREHQPTTYPLDMTRTTGQPARHKFDSKIEQIQARDGCSKLIAHTKARLENPEVFADYQRHIARQ